MPAPAPYGLAAKAATPMIPIAFKLAADPVKAGLVASLNRPGGNATGVTGCPELEPKRIELLHELVPATSNRALLVNPTNPSMASSICGCRAAARTLGLKIDALRATPNATSIRRLPPWRNSSWRARDRTDSFFISRREQLVALAARHSVPAIYP